MEFPYLFRAYTEHSSYQEHIETDSGWYKIIYNLCLALNAVIDKEGTYLRHFLYSFHLPPNVRSFSISLRRQGESHIQQRRN